MDSNFYGITFLNRNVTPAHDGVLMRTLLDDGILNGCLFSYAGQALVMQPGQLVACGRQIRLSAAKNWTISASSGYARILLTVDITRTSTAEAFDQAYTTVEYAASEDAFLPLQMEDINGAGTVYQLVLCVVALSSAGITELVYTLPEAAPRSDSLSDIVVSAPAGSTVTAMKGSVIKTAVERNGAWTVRGCDVGIWTVAASLGGNEAVASVSIQREGQLLRYPVTLSFFSATINVTYPAGSVCTCALGSTALTAPDTSGVASFAVPEAGSWVVSCSSGSDQASKTVAISADGEAKTVALYFNHIPVFTYTGSYAIVNDSDMAIATSTGNWKIRFLTSGILTISDLRGAESGIDVFLVGAGGGKGSNPDYGAGGAGGGGYTKTVKGVSVTAGTSYQITIGAGAGEGGTGGTTSAFGNSIGGGKPGQNGSNYAVASASAGGNGGSGGGAGGGITGSGSQSSSTGGAGGTNGGNGGSNSNGAPGGTGQGTTTREFGESSGKLYASGGDGRGSYSNSNAAANSGNGARTGSTNYGGSGIVVIRNRRG